MQIIFNKIFGKIADVFCIFDFSYFISGAVAFIQIYIFMSLNENNYFTPLEDDLNWWKSLIVIYILGLIMFALGRFIRQDMFKQKYRKYSLFEEYGICDKSKEKEIDMLFCQYWSNLRNGNDLKGYDYYSRLWVMTAVYEGLASNVLLALGLIMPWICETFNEYCLWVIFAALVVAVLMMFLLFREARKNAETIVKDFIVMNKKGLPKYQTTDVEKMGSFH